MTSDRRSNDCVRLSSGPVTLQIVASLLWIPQAALLSLAVGAIAAGQGLETAIWAGAGVLVLGIVRSMADALGARLAFRAARSSLSERRARAVAMLAALSPLDATRPSSGAAASALAEQAEAIVPYLARFRPARLKATVVPLAIFLCVLAFSWAAAFVLLVAAPLIPIFMALIGWRAKAASEAQLLELGGMNAFLLDRLRGLVTIRSLGAVDATARRLRADADNLRKRTMAVLRIAFLSSAVLELFAALGVAMVAVYVGFHLLGELNFGAWSHKLSLSQGLFILLLAPAFFEPLRDLSAVWHDRAAGAAALDALDRLSADATQRLNADAGANARPRPVALAGMPPEIVVKDLRFRHANAATPVFDGFDVTVAAGEHVALLAPSGCGKSTLLALVAGLAIPEAGSIAIGGEPLTAASVAQLQRRMAWIGQAPHIFAGTISSNVTLGRPEIGKRDVAEALHFAKLDGVAARRGAAPIGENGVGLSGGEALRLALARAAASPGAGLILADEPTGHLDRATAREITEGLITLATGRTLIVATHDPELAARMDRIIALTPASLEAAA
ncbi:thiol reductant ABC exporter subunit CydD [Rhodoligotrophos ferricapiens]|uniref:thiol reductant ABC exporter subunit CydD n=1 Tax=Rhodoligotrophos ferricapiens TaxID=3069264 RepID=UPI00315CA413